MKSSEVRALRERTGLGPSEAGKLVGRDYRTVHRWETGRAAPNAAAMMVWEMYAEGELPARFCIAVQTGEN